MNCGDVLVAVSVSIVFPADVFPGRKDGPFTVPWLAQVPIGDPDEDEGLGSEDEDDEDDDEDEEDDEEPWQALSLWERALAVR